VQPVSEFWKRFPKAYQDAVRHFDAGSEYTLHLKPGATPDVLPPLHPNARILYRTILDLHPASVLEVGCGSGDNLHNLKVLAPELEVYGFDLMQEQIEFAQLRSPELVGVLRRVDIAAPVMPKGTYDLVFTHAVIMHLESRVEAGIENVLRLARRHVVMVENWGSNDALAILRRQTGWTLRTISDGQAQAVVMEKA
jgi:SAM-dependent methyltransferase